MTDLTHLERSIRPIEDEDAVPGELVSRTAEARYVLIGEASHGTHEFYALRAALTRRLIVDHGFHAIAVEADWPDAARVDRYVRGDREEPSAGRALDEFTRFPLWMWRNTVVAGFVDWLRTYNLGLDRADQAGFYGLDLYSMYTSIDMVVSYLDRVDPDAAERARLRYACFDHAGVDGQRYGYGTVTGRRDSCEDDVVAQLVELISNRELYGGRDGRLPPDAYFDAEQNARLVANAERYYRSMFRGRDESWNLRDRHMADSLDLLVEYLQDRGVHEPRVVVWAHNSHLGDARATEMGWRRGELNLGQLVRQRHGDAAVNVGLTTYDGEVTAASDWEGPMLRKRVRPALIGSYEELFHRLTPDRFWLDLHDPAVARSLGAPRLERAIGVIYRPETERISHYFEARLPEQFDVLVHLDRTRALQPLDRTSAWEEGPGVVPATYPWAV